MERYLNNGWFIFLILVSFQNIVKMAPDKGGDAPSAGGGDKPKGSGSLFVQTYLTSC